MKYTTGEFISNNTRAAQMMLVLGGLEECETLENFKAARKRLRDKAMKTAAATTDLQGE